MLNLREIYKPRTLDEALELLKQPQTVALAGGTDLIARRPKDVHAVVDLSRLGLAYIRREDGALVIGAMTTLAEAATSPLTRNAADGVIAQAAQRSHASILRNQATVGGTLLVERAGIFAVALAALEARLAFVTGAPEKADREADLVEFLATPQTFLRGGILTAIVIPSISLTRRAALETVARTPRDKPIVCVCATLEIADGVARAVSLALGGVGNVVVRAVEAERLALGAELNDEVVARAAQMASERVTPPSDFRGSAAYRREMARVLTARALRECRDAITLHPH